MNTDNKLQMSPIRNYMIEQRKIVIDEIDNKTTVISNRVSTDKRKFNLKNICDLSVASFHPCISVAYSLHFTNPG